MTRKNDSQGSLKGLKVIDLSRVLSGPFCTMILGDMGAEIIKIESPAGDPVRSQGYVDDGFSWYFAGFNRNKKSVVLDLYTQEGKTTLDKMLATADVLVENFRPGVLARMGLTQDRLNAINPRLIVASINGFGSTGPYINRPAFDFVIQAMSGFMSVNGTDEGTPMRAAPPITDLLAGVYAALGIAAACISREKTGEGQHVEVSMMNSAISIMAYLSAEYFATGKMPTRTGNDHPIIAPYGLYRCRDGEIAVAPSNDSILERFLKVLGLEGILDEPEFATNSARFARRNELRDIIEARLASETQSVWIVKLNEAGVPCGKVQNIAEVFSDPHVLAQEMILDVTQSGSRTMQVLGFPIKLSKTPCKVWRPVPCLGEHTQTELSKLE